MLSARNRERGDTLVEVILGLTILSIISVGSFAIMSKGVNQSLTALEQSQVRTNLNAQTELLSYFRDQYVTARKENTDINTYPASIWTTIKGRAAVNSAQTVRAFNDCSGFMIGSFYLTYDSATSRYVINDMTAAKLATTTLAKPGEGLWIEPKGSISTGRVGFQPYMDMYVKGCWTPLASPTKQALSSVVRLYDTP